MPVIRTPDDRFENLPDFPYAPNYVDVDGLQMHYIDEGQGEVILCLHGEPSWSFLYRKMIPILSAKYRVVAPDFIGFGRSDKYTEIDEYSYQMHCDTMMGLLDAVGLTDITLVCQDWGGLIGLRLAAEHPDRFARLVIMNTGLPTGDQKMSEAFMTWREFARNNPDLPVGFIMQRTFAAGDDTDPAIVAAYEAPFPDGTYKAGVAAFPLLVPVTPDDPASEPNRRALEVLSKWTKPVQVMFSDGDPITRGGDRFFRSHIPGAQAQPEITIQGGGHFLQEDKGEEIAQRIVEFMERTPAG